MRYIKINIYKKIFFFTKKIIIIYQYNNINLNFNREPVFFMSYNV